MSQSDLLEKQEEWADTIEVKPKIKTNIKMKVAAEQRKEIEKICPLVKYFSEQTKYIFIYDEFQTWSENEDIFMKDTFEEIDADLFIRTNGTCIKKQEFTYPILLKNKKWGYFVKFYDLRFGKVIKEGNNPRLYVGFQSEMWTPHTNINVWEQVEEPKIIEDNQTDYKNEHYKLQKIDTVARCKANMTLEQQKAICIFNCDKYLHRSKGQDLEDIQKVRYYLDWLEEIENKLKDKQ